MMELKWNGKKLKSDCTQEMQAAIQLKTRAEDRIHWISHRERKFRAREDGLKPIILPVAYKRLMKF